MEKLIIHYYCLFHIMIPFEFKPRFQICTEIRKTLSLPNHYETIKFRNDKRMEKLSNLSCYFISRYKTFMTLSYIVQCEVELY